MRITNTLRLRQNGCHFEDDIFKCMSLNKNCWILNKDSLNYFSKDPIDNMTSLAQIMVWRRTSDKPLSKAMLVCYTDTYMYHSTSSYTDKHLVHVIHNLKQENWIYLTLPYHQPWPEQKTLLSTYKETGLHCKIFNVDKGFRA